MKKGTERLEKYQEIVFLRKTFGKFHIFISISRLVLYNQTYLNIKRYATLQLKFN